MKKALLWVPLGLVLLVGGGALAGLNIAALTVIGVILAVAGALILVAWSIIYYLQ